MDLKPTEVRTGLVRFSYAHVFEPKAVGNSEPKYSVSLIIPKSDKRTIAAIKNAIQTAYEEGENKLKGNAKTVPALKNLKHYPLKDGDEDRPDDEAYADSYFVNANSKTKPQVVDIDPQCPLSPSEFYSGCYGRAFLNFYAYNFEGNKGIAAGLQHVQKLRDGEPLGGGRRRAEDVFDDWDDDDADFLN